MNRHAASFKKKTTYCRASGTFRLRHFNLDHQTSSQKLGTDSLLLGAWASADVLSRWPESSPQLKALDVGTGSGCLALMLAQQASLANKDLTVDAIDIDHDTCGVARRNVEASPWPSLVRVQCLSFQDLVESSPPGSYEVIISNPPYFKGSTKPPSDRRATARHQDTALPFSALAAGASHLLSTNHPSSAIYRLLSNQPSDHNFERCFRKLLLSSF